MSKLWSNRFLEANDINGFFPNIFFKLGAPSCVAEATDVPKKRAHLDDAVAQAHPLEVIALATRLYLPQRGEEGAATPVVVSPSGRIASDVEGSASSARRSAC